MENQSASSEKLGWSRRILFSTLTLLLTVTVTLVAGEVLVRLIVPEETFWPVSNIYQTSEIRGVLYTYKRNYDRVAFGVALETNSLGFRGPEWSKEKPPGIFRIALIGDSHAFGYGVPYESSVGEVLATILKERYGTSVEVLNFGVNGYNSEQQQTVLKHLALGYDPDMVILMPTSNDHEPPLKVDQEGWLHWDGKSSNTESRIMDKSMQRVKNEDLRYWVSKSRLILYLLLIYERQQLQAQAQTEREFTPKKIPDRHWMNPVPPGPVSARLTETVYQPMVAMLTQIKARNIPVIVAPFAGQLDYRRMFQILERDHNVPIVELLARFPEARNWEEVIAKFGLGWDNHLNAVAHRRYAQGLAEAIETQGYLLGTLPGN